MALILRPPKSSSPFIIVASQTIPYELEPSPFTNRLEVGPFTSELDAPFRMRRTSLTNQKQSPSPTRLVSFTY